MKLKFFLACFVILTGLGMMETKTSWADSFAWNFESVSNVLFYYAPTTAKQELWILGKVEGESNPLFQGFKLVDLDPTDIRQKQTMDTCERMALLVMSSPAKYQFQASFQADHPVGDTPRPSFSKSNPMNCSVKAR